jgi:dihydrofolate synthase / folylpolyglutamate synthase
MNYQETLEYMFKQLPMYQRVGAAAYKNDLNNTIALCAHLGNPERSFRTVHIAGTNGKGSISHIIAAALQAAGYKTGLYTSPHYLDFRERIKINGKLMRKKSVVGFVARHKEYLEELQPSFFEMTVGLAFDYFRAEQVDIAIIETGLGGRLDSTNVITPLLSVITNISYDHMALLGSTLPLIAAEKAGIIKKNVPVVIGERQENRIWEVFEQKARASDAALYSAEEMYAVKVRASESHFGDTVYDIEPLVTVPSDQRGKRPAARFEIDALCTDLAGPYQIKNLQTAISALEVLSTLLETAITETVIREGLSSLRTLVLFMGRWQFLGKEPTILCDSAHNEAGLKFLFEEVTKMPFERLHIVCGFANDKDLGGVLPLFPAHARYYFAKANIPRGLAAELLSEQAVKYHLHGKPYQSVVRALAAARKSAKINDLIVVTGSIFVIAEVI